MALTKVTKGGITNDAVDGDKLKDGSITTAKIGASAIESSEINDGTVIVDDLASTLNLSSKTVTLPNTSVTAGMLSNTLDLSSKTVTFSGSTIAALKQPIQDNIGLLGFKMAVNDGLTVFNLIDGVVDEFHDESGTDEAEGSNDLYCGTSDYYINSTTPDGSSGPMAGFSAGFGNAPAHPYESGTITEPDTSTIQRTNPAAAYSVGQAGDVNIDQELGTFTVPSGVTTLNAKVWGAGGGAGCGPAVHPVAGGGGGGYVTGDLAVTGEQVLTIAVGFGGGSSSAMGESPGSGVYSNQPTQGNTFHLPGKMGHGGSGGGLSGVFTADIDYLNKGCGFSQDGATQVGGSPVNRTNYAPFVPNIALIAGAGDGGSRPSPTGTRLVGGAGGGLIGQAGDGGGAQVTAQGGGGGGGSQAAGGQGSPTPAGNSESDTIMVSAAMCASGGNGYYAGGSGGYVGGGCSPDAGGGGSSYYGHPQITSGATEGGSEYNGGGTAIPGYVPGTNEGTNIRSANTNQLSEPGYILITGLTVVCASATSTTITSEPFASGTVATSARIVVFEENIDTPTLNTDIIASVSRDGGTTFTAATLADSGYVTGSSGQRILTGQATISGQPSGQSMRWKLALANNTVKIHGVSLQWS